MLASQRRPQSASQPCVDDELHSLARGELSQAQVGRQLWPAVLLKPDDLHFDPGRNEAAQRGNLLGLTLGLTVRPAGSDELPGLDPVRA